MKPKQIYQVVFYTQLVGSLIYSEVMCFPETLAALVIYFPLSLILSIYCLFPFYALIILFQYWNIRRIPYDGWLLQAIGCVGYFLYFHFSRDAVEDSLIWALCYFPAGIGFFYWYHLSKLKG